MKTKEETAFQEAQPEAFDEPDDELEEFDEIGEYARVENAAF